MPKIVISYRRQDSEAIAGRIRDRLAGHYGAESVFMDIDSIPFGTDFREHIRNVLATTDIVIAIIGPRWTGASRGRPARIREPTDPVRIEVERALEHGTALVPVLVNGARMPKPEELPDTLQDLSYRNAAEVDSGRDFHQHLDRLIRSLDQMLAAMPHPEAGAAAAAAPGAPEAPAQPATPPPEAVAAAAPTAAAASGPVGSAAPAAVVGGAEQPGSPRLWPLLAAAAAICAILLVAGVYLYLRPPGGNPAAVVEKPAPVPVAEPAVVPAVFDTSCKRAAGTEFYDDFKSPDGGWGQPTETKFFKDGRMVLHPKTDAATSWLYFPLLFSKKIVVCSEMTAPSDITSAASEAAGGIMFWATDYDNYYVAEGYLDGSYAVWRKHAGKWISVVPRSPSEHLHQGPGAVNQLKIAAASRNATLSINGVEIITFWGQAPRRGGAVGLFGQSEAAASDEWRFSGIAVIDDKRPAPPADSGPRAAFLGSCGEPATARFVDEFATPDPGWGTGIDRRFFKDGQMIIKPAAKTFSSWIFPPLLFTRGAVCADVKSPPAFNNKEGAATSGVIFWASDLSNFYVAQIYADGSYSIYRRIAGRWASVLPRAKDASIHAGEEVVNRLKIVFEGNSASFSVNGTTVAKVPHAQPPPGGGAVGMYAESESDLESPWSFLRIAVLDDDHPPPATPAVAGAAGGCKPATPVAFAEDFTAPDPGWGKPGADYFFAGNQMVLLPKADTNVTWIYTPLVFTGAAVCAELKYPSALKNPADVACGGLVFWAADYKNYYLAAIYTDGSYVVRRKIDGRWHDVVPRSHSDAIRTGPDTVNQIKVTTDAGRAMLMINDKQIAGFWGQAPGHGGAVGLYGQSETEQADEWHFLAIAVGTHKAAEASASRAAQDAAKTCKPEGALAFVDDFSPPDPGWGQAGPLRFFRDRQMVLKPEPGKIEPWIYEPLLYSSATICADITSPPPGGEDGAAAGIIFWASNDRNYHIAQFYPDGTYSLWRKIDGEWATVIPRTAASAIRQGPGAVNRMKVAINHDAVTVMINDATVITFHGQPRESGGAVGFYAGAGKSAASEWHFANLVVVN